MANPYSGWIRDDEYDLIAPYLTGNGFDIGCGGMKVKPSVGVDHIGYGLATERREDSQISVADWTFDARALPVKNATLDFVFASHSLEHIGTSTGVFDEPKTVALREWTRCLKAGGYLVLIVPDIRYAQVKTPEGMVYHGLTPDDVRTAVMDVDGLEIISVDTLLNDWTFEVIARKLPSRHILMNGKRGVMYLLRGDNGLSAQLLNHHGRREGPAPALLEAAVNEGDVVIDIGANLGYFVLCEYRKARQVYAIEPVPENITALDLTIAHNRIRNVQTYCEAFGDHEGAVAFERRPNFSNHGRVVKEGGDLTVPLTTLDAFVKREAIREVNYLRMDVEGGEREILQGGMETISAMPRGSGMFLELHANLFEDADAELWKPAIQPVLDAGFVISDLVHVTVNDAGAIDFWRFVHYQLPDVDAVKDIVCKRLRSVPSWLFFERR